MNKQRQDRIWNELMKQEENYTWGLKKLEEHVRNYVDREIRYGDTKNLSYHDLRARYQIRNVHEVQHLVDQEMKINRLEKILCKMEARVKKPCGCQIQFLKNGNLAYYDHNGERDGGRGRTFG